MVAFTGRKQQKQISDEQSIRCDTSQGVYASVLIYAKTWVCMCGSLSKPETSGSLLLGYVGAPRSVLGPGSTLALNPPPAPRVAPAMWGVPVASWGNGKALELCQHLCTLPQAQEALGAPPGSVKQAPGQLVAISSVDYLVAMPSGARALSPVPWDTLLADVWGSLGLNAYKHVGIAAYASECKCGSVCITCVCQDSARILACIVDISVFLCVCLCAHMYTCLRTYTCLCVHTQIYTVLFVSFFFFFSTGE